MQNGCLCKRLSAHLDIKPISLDKIPAISADSISKCIFMNENFYIFIRI